MKKIGILVGILIAMLVTAVAFQLKKDHIQRDLAKEVFRFHVLANSDSMEDQALKMKVKEAVIAYMKQELPKAESAKETKTWAQAHCEEITELAQHLVWNEGYSYRVSAEVTECEFPDKSYGDITFPAGEYEALRVAIGDAKGKNWWCVLYPNLCFIDAVHAVVPKEGKEELKTVLEEDTYEMVTATSKFKIRWFFF